MKPKWMTAAAIATLSGAFFALPVYAQLASPQWSRPAMDSTHVTGTAERVMPETSTGGTSGLKEVKDSAPSTIQELLAAFDGVTLEMPGNERVGAFEQMRFIFTADKMQTQFTALWNWYDSCSATADSPRCSHGNLHMMLSPEGLFVVRQGCGSQNGNAGGSAEFKWSDFVALGGKKSPAKNWTLQRGTFWANCYPESGSND